MKIDWFTVVAQLINFLILLWLIKRFLFKPILNAIDAREKHIADKVAHAEAQKAEAEELKAEYERKSDSLNAQSDAFLKTAQEEANEAKVQLMEKARDDAEAFVAQRKEAALDEEKLVRHTLRQKIQDEVLGVTRQVLTDLAGVSFDEQAVEAFNERLRNVSDEKSHALKAALKTSNEGVTVKTVFELSSELQSATSSAIQKITGADTAIKFETSPKLINGIELSVNGYKVAWSVADYLSSLEESFIMSASKHDSTDGVESNEKVNDDGNE